MALSSMRAPADRVPSRRALTLIGLSVFAYIQVVSSSFTVVVPYEEEECFTIRTPAGAKAMISGSYEVLDDEDYPVRVALHDDDGRDVWVSDEDETEGLFSVEGAGRYEFCITNDFGHEDSESGDGRDRTVGFSLRVTLLPRGLEAEDEGPDDLKTTELLASSTQLVQMLENMEDHQDYLRSRESVHRDLVEATFRRVVRWTVLEALVLIMVAGGQVLYLKKFFERRSYL